jgi:hypothetical protein
MRSFTANGMDVKGMKGYTNPSKWDVTRYPPKLAGLYAYEYHHQNLNSLGNTLECCFGQSTNSTLECSLATLYDHYPQRYYLVDYT